MKKYNRKLYLTLYHCVRLLQGATLEQLIIEKDISGYPIAFFTDMHLGEDLPSILTFEGQVSGLQVCKSYPNLFVYDDNVDYDIILKDYVKELFNYIAIEYGEEIATEIEINKIDNWFYNTLNNKTLAVIYSLCNLANLTYEKYSTLLNFYASKKADLMNALTSSYSDVGASTSKSENLNLSNDTPQEVYDEDYSDNNYASSTSKGKSENSVRTNLNHTEQHEGDTLIARLKEIEDKYSNIMEEWIKEFDKFFTSNLNVADYEDYTGCKYGKSKSSLWIKSI